MKCGRDGMSSVTCGGMCKECGRMVCDIWRDGMEEVSSDQVSTHVQ